MQKTLLLLSAGLLLGVGHQAQAQYKGRGGNTSIGIKAGASLTSFEGADTRSSVSGNDYFDYRFGFHAGVFANVGLSKLFAFQPEVLYSQRGAYNNGSTNNGYRLHYVDVPLAFHLNTDGFFLEAGPQVGFLVSASRQVGSLSSDNTGDYKSFDVGYLAGLGYQMKHGPGIGLRYNGGFTNVPKEIPTVIGTIQARERNSAFQLYVTYSFN